MKFLEGHTVGIDLGTTYSAIAMLDHDGNPQVLQNADGRDITPSVVLLDEDRVVVGPSFERISVANPDLFWDQVWDYCGVVGEKGARRLIDGDNARRTP